MPMPKIQGADLQKPLCYDPARGKFILYSEILDRAEPIVPLETLSDDDLKKLVLERLRAGPDFKVQAMSGRLHTRNDVIRAVEQGEPFGRLTLEAERSHLRDLLAQIKSELEG